MANAVLLTGGCTAPGIAMGLRLLMPELNIKVMYIHEVLAPGGKQGFESSIRDCNVWIYMDCYELRDFASEFEGVPYPKIAFNAFHPDEVRGFTNGNYLMSVTQDINSAIGLWGYKKGLSARDTASLMRQDVFEELGYFEYWESSVAALEHAFSGTSLDYKAMFNRVKRRMPFMLTTLHPNMHFVAEIARQIALQIGYSRNPYIDPIEDCMYEMLGGIPSPFFPGVAERFGFRGALRWRSGDRLFPDPESYFDACFSLYPSPELISCDRLADGAYDAILGRRF